MSVSIILNYYRRASDRRTQPRLSIQILLTNKFFIAVHHAQRFQDVPAFLLEICRDIYKLEPSMSEAIR